MQPGRNPSTEQAKEDQAQRAPQRPEEIFSNDMGAAAFTLVLLVFGLLSGIHLFHPIYDILH